MTRSVVAVAMVVVAALAAVDAQLNDPIPDPVTTRGLRVEVARHNIFTTLVCPGWIRTPLTEKVDAPMPKLMDVEPAVRQIINAIRRHKRFYAFPRSIAWRLSLLRWLPAAWSDWLISQMVRSLKKN